MIFEKENNNKYIFTQKIIIYLLINVSFCIYFSCFLTAKKTISICNSNIDNNNFNCCLRAQKRNRIHEKKLQCKKCKTKTNEKKRSTYLIGFHLIKRPCKMNVYNAIRLCAIDSQKQRNISMPLYVCWLKCASASAICDFFFDADFI